MQVRLIATDGTGTGEGLTVSPERTFKTGSRGYNVSTKLVVNGVRYQFSGNMIEIGSKPGI